MPGKKKNILPAAGCLLLACLLTYVFVCLRPCVFAWLLVYLRICVFSTWLAAYLRACVLLYFRRFVCSCMCSYHLL